MESTLGNSNSRNKAGDALLRLAQQRAAGELCAECDDDLFWSCRLAGVKGGAKVVYALGMCYHFGWGAARDLGAAIECYVNAAEIGSSEALDRLWQVRGCSSAENGLQSALRRFCTKAAQGDARAQFSAGFCYFEGIGTPQDIAKARDLFLKAADQKCADALVVLEECRQKGVGGGYKGMRGLELLRYAAEMGSARAQNELGYAHYIGSAWYDLDGKKDYEQAIMWWQKAADQSYACAASDLAWYCYKGECEQRDVKKAFQLFKKAALMGDAVSQHTISCFARHKFFELSEREWPVGIDYFEAAYQNRKAVDQNYGDAERGMPSLLRSIGLAQEQIDELIKQTSSFESAKIWYDIAIQYETGDGAEKNENKGFQMYRLAARFGSIQAKTALGRCCELGVGTGVDLGQAAHWCEKAAVGGDYEAAQSLLDLIRPKSATMALNEGSAFAALAECYESGSGAPRNEDTALLMREHAAAKGDTQQAKTVIKAYISGNDNEHRIRDVVLMVARTPGLSSRDYRQFIDRFHNHIDELDQMLIFQKIAAAVRAETLGIEFVLD